MMAAPVQANVRGCDFCTTDQRAAFVYPCRSFYAAMVKDGELLPIETDDGEKGRVDHFIGSWMACAECSSDIEAGAWGRLLDRFAGIVGDRKVADAIVPTLWAGFRDNRVGARMRIEELDGCRHEHTEAVRNPANPAVEPGLTCVTCGDVVERLQ